MKHASPFIGLHGWSNRPVGTHGPEKFCCSKFVDDCFLYLADVNVEGGRRRSLLISMDRFIKVIQCTIATNPVDFLNSESTIFAEPFNAEALAACVVALSPTLQRLLKATATNLKLDEQIEPFFQKCLRWDRRFVRCPVWLASMQRHGQRSKLFW